MVAGWFRRNEGRNRGRPAYWLGIVRNSITGILTNAGAAILLLLGMSGQLIGIPIDQRLSATTHGFVSTVLLVDFVLTLLNGYAWWVLTASSDSYAAFPFALLGTIAVIVLFPVAFFSLWWRRLGGRESFRDCKETIMLSLLWLFSGIHK